MATTSTQEFLVVTSNTNGSTKPKEIISKENEKNILKKYKITVIVGE